MTYQLDQYLIPVIIGAFLGIILVVAIVKSITRSMIGNMGPMMGGGMMGYRPYYNHSGGALAAVFFVFLFLIGTIIMVNKVRQGENTLTDRWKEEAPNRYNEFSATEEEPTLGELERELLEGVQPANRRYFNESPSKSRKVNRSPSAENGFVDASEQPILIGQGGPRGAPESKTEEEDYPPQDYSMEDYHREFGNFYIQCSAGKNEQAALRAVRQMQKQYPDRAWLGVGQDDNPFKILIGPFQTESQAKGARHRLGVKGYTKNVIEESIKVYSAD